jgi:hypothetical protein
MPFRDYSSYFASDEMDAFIAAYEAAWEHLCATGTSCEQAAVLQKKLGQIILASACMLRVSTQRPLSPIADVEAAVGLQPHPPRLPSRPLLG